MNVIAWEMSEGKITSIKYGDNVFNLKVGLSPDNTTKDILKKIDENLKVLYEYLSFVDVRIEKREIVKEVEVEEEKTGRIKYMRAEDAYQKMLDVFGAGIFSKKEADKLLDRNSYLFIKIFLDEGKVIKGERGKYKFAGTSVKMVEDLKYKQGLLK